MEMKHPFPQAGSMVIEGTPIAIYQMGKVGSQTIRESLRALDLSHSVHHLHYLSAENLKKLTRRRSRQRLPVSRQLEQGKLIRKYLDTSPAPALKVICAVREPVAQLMSSIFQNVETHCPESIRADGSLDVAVIQSHVREAIERYDIQTAENCNWFDQDFRPALGIDVYAHEFDQRAGYTQFSQSLIDVLILRLENSQDWCHVISRFLQLYSPLSLVRTNHGCDKHYRHAYEYVRRSLRFSPESLQRIYSSRYCRHFYSSEMIDLFIQRWSNSGQLAA